MKLNYFLVSLFLIFLYNCENKVKKDNSSPSTPPIKPNVIVILADDLGYKDVGFNGSEDIKTPNIDQLANNGTIFTNGYVSYAVCGPSRAGLITGRYQDRFGFGRNPLFAPKDSLQGLPTSEETLADAVGKAGYQSMAIGKWHLGAHKSQRPLKRGFNEFFGFLTGGHKYFPEQWTKQDISEVTSQGDAYNTKLLRNNDRVEENEYLTDALSREAVNFVERNAENPFFLYLAYNAPHTPLQATEKYLSRYTDIKDKKRKTYAAMVSAVDDGVGSLLNKLRELDIENNTIVFFLSDNGGPEQHGANNGKLREGKGSLHEGGIRVPFAVQWPGTIPARQLYNQPVISLDIFATAVALAGVSPKHQIDGTNLIPYLQGLDKSRPHEHLFWRHYDAEAYTIRQGDMKLVKNKKGEVGLYNLANDISETTPINNDSLRHDLKTKHDIWDSENMDPIFLGLRHNNIYNKQHPDRFTDVEKY
ncbi:sulfatase-like hydrolase/transferase [Snuella sedimenti]|uniref:Sulfatase-like hydrolase/transferase n=1 Tax=Snuella sedimenti TaxID=2798802 RepID=A0A8J7LP80_9FLAO|nr:sulfatase-like hydrolase/transferase [Snuella sedimenti]MBJ6368968.1 sulfatase-like hydrolase/transferase [Snuella sedimenti]